ncbi:hypothetical protein A1D31_02550 [Bradyrhizobium liaoningense]|nr:hypothetical protein A1D31_02550 [Bradyrhizobium liaoningense]
MEKTPGADLLREMIGLAAQRLMEPEVEGQTGAAYVKKSPERLTVLSSHPGAHIDLHLTNVLIRSYSLLNDQRERHRYAVAVNKDPASRGGSTFIHDQIRAGDTVTASGPRNDFALVEHADHSILIAGGIGITPLLAASLSCMEDVCGT